MWQWVARGSIQQIKYIPQTEQHLPFRLMLLRLGNATIICCTRQYHILLAIVNSELGLQKQRVTHMGIGTKFYPSCVVCGTCLAPPFLRIIMN